MIVEDHLSLIQIGSDRFSKLSNIERSANDNSNYFNQAFFSKYGKDDFDAKLIV